MSKIIFASPASEQIASREQPIAALVEETNRRRFVRAKDERPARAAAFWTERRQQFGFVFADRRSIIVGQV
jgi:hypothetical protein